MKSILSEWDRREDDMTQEALTVLESCEVIVGYTVYLDLLGERFSGKTFLSTPMRQEVERCRMCYEEAGKGKRVALICSGDARNLRDGVAHV